MVSTAWLLPMGFAVGALGTLIGAGGGFILMPILLLLNPQASPERLTSISLAVVFANALAGSAAYARMRRIDYRSGLLFAAASVPGAILGACSTSAIPRRVFDGVFGGMMLAVSVLLLVRGVPRNVPEGTGPSPRRRFLGAGLSAAVGYLSSVLGIGGGILHVPGMVYLLGFPVHAATATSHFVLAIMAGAGTAAHLVSGTLGTSVVPTLLLSAGVIPGALAGAWVSKRVVDRWILRALGVGLGFLGLRVALMAFRST